MTFNPVLSSFKFLSLSLSGKVHQHPESDGKTIDIQGNCYTIFRHISIKKNRNGTPPVVLILRFKFRHSSLKKDKFESFFQIPVFAGLPGFEGKCWTFDEANGIFQGVYQWESRSHAEEYLQSFAVQYVKKKSTQPVESFIIPEKGLADMLSLK